MADNLNITPGAGATIATEQSTSDGAHMQVIRIAYSAAGVRTYVQADVDGLLVNVGQIQGPISAVTSITNTVTVAGTVAVTGTVAVSAAATAPVFVRLSTGTAAIDTIPVSIAATVNVAGTVAVGGTVGVTQSGSWTIAAVTSITDTVTVAGTVGITGTVTVAGTVTANQGTAAAIGNAWYTRVTDGTNPVGVTGVSGAYGLNVNVLAQAGGGVSQADQSTFTNAATPATPVAGVFNDSITAVGAGKAGAVRITANRAQHVNLRDALGGELGTAAGTALIVIPSGGGVQPVNGTVTVNQGATAWVTNITQVNGAAAAGAAAGVLPVQNVPSGGGGGATQTPWRSHVILSASQSTQQIHAPASGKTAYIEGLAINLSAGGGILYIYDDSTSAANRLWASTVTWAFQQAVFTPARPIPLSAINRILRYDTGASVVGDIVAWGYDA